MSTYELESLINAKLDSDDNCQEIENFFSNQGWVYDYDQHAGRYQVRDPREDHLPDFVGRHQIYVYIDDQENFLRAEVVKIYNVW